MIQTATTTQENMSKKVKPPTRLSDFKSKPLHVTVVKHPKDKGDVAATQMLMDLYCDKDGFHCPKCGETMLADDKAITHLTMEMNKSLSRLAELSNPKATTRGREI